MSTRISDGFEALIAPLHASVLDSSPSTICGTWPDHRIGYVNPAWTDFALANGAVRVEDTCGLGVDVLAVTPLVLRPFYERLFNQALETKEPVEHDYECSSADEYRLFRMRIHPCTTGALVMSNALVRASAHQEEALASAELESLYRSVKGMVVQCSNCRRVRRGSDGDAQTATWDWVPTYVAKMPASVSHGICPVCLDYYYS